MAPSFSFLLLTSGRPALSFPQDDDVCKRLGPPRQRAKRAKRGDVHSNSQKQSLYAGMLCPRPRPRPLEFFPLALSPVPCALRKRIAARGRRHKTALVQVSAATVCSGAGRLPAKGPPFTFVSALPRFFRSLFSPLLLSVDAVILCRRRVLSSPKLPLHSFSGHSLLNKHQTKNPTDIFQSTTFSFYD